MLAEMLKELSFKPGFIDYFSEALEKTQKKKTILKHFDEIMKVLELSCTTYIIIALSLSLAADEAMKQKGVSYLKQKLKEYPEPSKQIEVPDHLVPTVIRFLRTCDKHNISQEEVNAWLSLNQKAVRQQALQPLGLSINPNLCLSDEPRAASSDMSDIEQKNHLRDLLFELGPSVTHEEEILRSLFAEIGKVTEKDITLTINMMAESSPFPEQELPRDSQKLIRTAYSKLLNTDSKSQDSTFQDKHFTEWNYRALFRVLDQPSKKPNWTLVLKLIDSPEFCLNSKPAFLEFVKICEVIKDLFKVSFPRELFFNRWENFRAQIKFIERFLELGRTDVSIYRDQKNKNFIEYDSNPPVRGTPSFVNSGMEIWLNKDFVARLVELSDSHQYNTIRDLFEVPTSKYPELILATLSQIHPKCGHALLESIFNAKFPDFMDNATSHTRIIDYIYKTNFALLCRTFARLCKKDKASLNLSRILDISQSIKGMLQNLHTSEDYEFSIPLGLLASKREFLNLKTWAKDKIESQGERFIEALMDFIRTNVLRPAQEAKADEANFQKRLDAILENAYLSIASLSNLVDSLSNHSSTSREAYSDVLVKKIDELKRELVSSLPITSGNTNKIEIESSRILSDVYSDQMKLEDFLEKLVEFKKSTKEQEKEIFACIIHNLFVEYPYFTKLSKPNVEKTGIIFGNFIKREILDTISFKVCLQSILDALKKKDKLFDLGHAAILQFKSMIHTNAGACKNLFEIDQLREKHPEILFEILQNIRKHCINSLEVISDKYISEIDAKMLRQRPDEVRVVQQPQQPQLVALPLIQQPKKKPHEPTLIDPRHIDTTTLMEEINRIFSADIETIQISDPEKREINQLFNSLDPSKVEEKAKILNPIVSETWINYVSQYLVWKRVPSDYNFLELYRDFLTKLNKKELSAKVLTSSYKLINLIFDYTTYRKTVAPAEEKKTIRNCGSWFGIITLGSNRPIIKKELDLKLRLYNSYENKSLANTMPIITSLLSSIEKSTVFKVNNPYIMGILGILLEIKNEPTQNENNPIALQINILIKDTLKIANDKDIKHFGFIGQKKIAKTNAPIHVRSLAESIFIDMRALESYTNELDIDLKQLVAIALDNSIRDITKPSILSRSVNIALNTTRELILKDYAFEADEEKLIKASEQMVSKLAGNLALVTCTEPLKNSIKEYLENQLKAQTSLPERSRKNIKDIATSDNLALACNHVRKVVVEKALSELNKDKEYLLAIEKRKKCKESTERFMDERFAASSRSLPNTIRPQIGGIKREDHRIYTNFGNDMNGNAPDHEQEPLQAQRRPIAQAPAYAQYPQQPAHNPSPSPAPIERRAPEELQTPPNAILFNDSRFFQYIMELEKYLQMPVSDDRTKCIHLVYKNISRMLNSYQSQATMETSNVPPATIVLENLFKPTQNGQTLLSNERIRSYSDILVICCNYNPKLTKSITEWFFTAPHESKWNHSILTIFLRRNLLHISDFDAGYANVLEHLEFKNVTPLDCIVYVLKSLVIEQKIFAIYTFKRIVEKLIGIQRKKVAPIDQIFSHLAPEVSTFIEHLADFMKMNNDYTYSIQLRLTNIDPQYKKLFKDVDDYFKKPDLSFYKLAVQMFKKWLVASSEEELTDFIKSFEEEITKKDSSFTIGFFCYSIDMACRRAERFYYSSRKLVKLDYSFVDIVSKMVTILLKAINTPNMNNLRITLLENVLTAIIIVMTKEHHYNSSNFNNKVFFKLLFNILYDLNWPDYGFEKQLKGMLITIVQALHIIQPIKYPGFAFSWLQLISSKFLMGPVLKDNSKEDWTSYNMLISDLIVFYKEVFTPRSMTTPEMKSFYKGTLRLLLVLLHDFPDFLCQFSFSLLEEIPDNFMQVKNIMVSAYPKGMRIPDPFEQEQQVKMDNGEEFNKMPVIHPKIEDRINSHNLHVSRPHAEPHHELHQEPGPARLREHHEELLHLGLQERHAHQQDAPRLLRALRPLPHLQP